MREGLPNRGNDLKCMVGWVGTKQLAACSRYNVPTLFRNLLKRSSSLITLCCFYRSRRGRDRMVVGFTTTCAISAYYH
jgi:hypothetical protein